MRKKLVAALLLAAAVSACGRGADEAVSARCVVGGLESVGGPFALQDHTGRAVTQADFSSKPTLLYFGFASCPDVCPMALQTARAALEERPADAPPVQVALVTLDPERDTQDKLSQYVESEAFPPGTIGLRGDRAAVDAAARTFRVLHRRNEDEGGALGYSIDHSSFFYLMDRNWRTLALFPSELPPTEIAACIDKGLGAR
jgi:cytochrome oxidase Cu insertion factor (SCO1/SenC/PrrC family)